MQVFVGVCFFLIFALVGWYRPIELSYKGRQAPVELMRVVSAIFVPLEVWVAGVICTFLFTWAGAILLWLSALLWWVHASLVIALAIVW